MHLTDKHLEAIKTAALPVEFGSITIKAGTDKHIDIIVENRMRLPKEPYLTQGINTATEIISFAKDTA
jgi:hypothetical protein